MSAQAAYTETLFGRTPAKAGDVLFDGSTYVPAHDLARLSRQLRAVFTLMVDGRWRTLGEISAKVDASETSVSARLRDLRKVRFGAHTVERRRRGDPGSGVHEYKLIAKESS